jgi:DNA-directed RNA polymerase specialized sigma24 family protein
VLWKRHAEYIRRSCQRLCRQFHVELVTPEDLASVTWIKVNDRADQYRAGEDTSATAQLNRTRAWMNTIAENQLIDWMRNPHLAERVGGKELDRALEDYSGQEFAFLCGPKFQAENSSYRLSLVAEAFEEVLNEKEQLVLRATVAHRLYSPGGTYMERGSATALATKLNTTAAALRKCRERAFKKIAVFVNARDPNK